MPRTSLVEDVTVYPMNPTPYVNGINESVGNDLPREYLGQHRRRIAIYGDGVRLRILPHDFVHYLNDPNWGGGPSHDDAIQVQAGTGVQLWKTLTGAFNAAVMVTFRMWEPRRILRSTATGSGLRWLFDQLRIERPLQDRDASEQNRFGCAQRVSGRAIIHNSTKSDLVPPATSGTTTGQPVTPSRGK